MNGYSDIIKPSLSYYSFLLLPTQNERCPYCSLGHHHSFHKMCLLCNFSPCSPLDVPIPPGLVFSVRLPLVLSIQIKRDDILIKAGWPFPPIVECIICPPDCLVEGYTVQCFGLYYYGDGLLATDWEGKQRIHADALAYFNTSAQPVPAGVLCLMQ